MEDNSGKLTIDGLRVDDLALFEKEGVDLAAALREEVHSRAEQMRERRHARRARLIDEVASSDQFGYMTTDEIVSGIHADRREAGWE